MMPPPDRSLPGLLVALLSLGLTSGAAAQEPPASLFGDEVEVREVLMDVIVTDRNGSVIVGLEEPDFLVVEDGTVMEIEGVSFYSNRTYRGAAGESGPEEEEAKPDERYFVLLYYRPTLALDRDLALRARLPEAGRQSATWMHHNLLPNDLLAVLSYDGRLRLAHDFTRQHDRLDAAISLASRGRLPAKRWPSRTVDAPPGISLAPLADSEAAEGDLFEVLAELAASLGRIEGRKILILFGPNFPARETHARQVAYRQMVEALNAHNVAVYSIDVAGRGRYPTPARLAEATGGNYIYDDADIVTGLERIQRENSGYYLLSYKSRHPVGANGFQRVEVKTRNLEFEVRARSGYRYGDS